MLTTDDGALDDYQSTNEFTLKPEIAALNLIDGSTPEDASDSIHLTSIKPYYPYMSTSQPSDLKLSKRKSDSQGGVGDPNHY